MIKKLLFFIGGVAAIVILIVLFNFFWDDTTEYKDVIFEPEIEVIGESEPEIFVDLTQPSPSPKAKSADDNRFISFLHLAREQFRNGLLAESKNLYQEAIKNGASEKFLVANAWFELYYVFVALDDTEAARTALDTAIEMDPGNDTFLNAKTLFEKRLE